MRHLRVMCVVAKTQCEKCKKDFSYICLGCHMCEACHLTQMVEDKTKEDLWLWRTPFVLLLSYAVVVAIVWTGVSYQGMKAEQDHQKTKPICACEK